MRQSFLRHLLIVGLVLWVDIPRTTVLLEVVQLSIPALVVPGDLLPEADRHVFVDRADGDTAGH